MNMGGDALIFDESPTDDEFPAEQPVLQEQPIEEEGIDDVTLGMAANIADELDKEEKPEPDPKEVLREGYRQVAAEMPLVEEVINGLTTFREALEEIITDMYKVGDESSLREFENYYATMSTLLGNPLLEGEERKDLYRFSLLHSEKASKKFRKTQLIYGGGSAVAWGAGEYLARQPKHVQIGLILKAMGMGGVGGTVIVELQYGLRGHKLGKKTAAVREVLYKAAGMFDSEVKELFSGNQED